MEARVIARSLIGAALAALVLSSASAQAPQSPETYIQAGRVLADPTTGRIETCASKGDPFFR